MANEIIQEPRDFPAIEELLQDESLRETMLLVPRPIAAEIIKDVVATNKKQLLDKSAKISRESLFRDISSAIMKASRQTINRVVNATGIIVHTNLGRSPIDTRLFDAVREAVIGYGNVEFDLNTGGRGKRGAACESYLAQLTGAESATVVNNCAAALFVILNSLANRKKVLLSRGELVQIGGGFRIPDILRKSGAKLTEVGTTNITSVDDYRSGADDSTALILKVHKSNFVQSGFTQEADIKQLVALGRELDLPVVNDLGSGVLVPTGEILGYREPTVQQSVRDGADLTCFSGDKMLGGPQAGLIVGRRDLIAKLKKNPIFRALRVDKLTFAMLERLFETYLNDNWQTDIKLWSIVSTPESELYRRAKKILADLGEPSGLSVEATQAYVGGGALPESALPSVGIVFSTEFKATRLMKTFRNLPLPIIGRIENERFILDLKAIAEDELPLFTDAIASILDESGRE